jgi:N4-gp56 family major capsid protein
MAVTNSVTASDLRNQYQKHFKPELLTHAINELKLNDFAKKSQLPKNAGSKSVSFMRRVAAAASNVQTLAANESDTVNTGEGTPIATFTTVNYEEVNVRLAQYGEAIKLTDILTWTQLYNSLKDGIALMGEDCALKADEITRDAIIAGVTAAGQRRYAQGAANFAGLLANAASAAKAVATDYLDAVTRLKVNKAPKIGGFYVGIIAPQVSRDLMNDDDWLEAYKYNDAGNIHKGEIGRIHGVRFVEATNPFIEDDTEGTYDAADGGTAGLIYSTIITGRDAYGVTELSGSSPFSPQIVICDKADKSDPLNQFLTAGWKAFYAAKTLNQYFAVVLKSKSTFTA